MKVASALILLVIARACAGGSVRDDSSRAESCAAVTKFLTAMMDNDLAAARSISVEGPEDRGVLEDQTAEMAAMDEYDRAIQKRFGALPTDAWRLRIHQAKFADVDLSKDGDVGWVKFLAGYPVRRVNGAWKVDIAEWNYAKALSDEREITRDNAAGLRKLAAEVSAGHFKQSWDADNAKANAYTDHGRRFERRWAKAIQLRAERSMHDAQGQWVIQAGPSEVIADGATKDLPNGGRRLEMRIRVIGTRLTAEGATQVTGGAADLETSEGGVCSTHASESTTGRSWVVSPHRAVGTIEGSISIQGRGFTEVFRFSGTRAGNPNEDRR